MIIIGAGGHAKEVIQILHKDELTSSLYFFDNTPNASNLFLGKFPVLSSDDELKQVFSKDPRFVCAISGTSKREIFMNKIKALGGKFTSVIAPNASIGNYDVVLADGLNVMQMVFISNNVCIGEGTLLNYGASVHHDCTVGKFCEISPKAQLLGGSSISDYVTIGAGATVLPKVKIGNNAVVAAGCVVTKNVPDNTVVAGVPGRVIKVLTNN